MLFRFSNTKPTSNHLLTIKNSVKSGQNIARKFGRIQIQICHVHRNIATLRKSAWKSHTKISQKLTLPKMSL